MALTGVHQAHQYDDAAHDLDCFARRRTVKLTCPGGKRAVNSGKTQCRRGQVQRVVRRAHSRFDTYVSAMCVCFSLFARLITNVRQYALVFCEARRTVTSRASAFFASLAGCSES